MPRIFNYYKNYSKYYCNPFFLDFDVGLILKMYKDHKARLYFQTQYKRNPENLHAKKTEKASDCKITSEEISEDNRSNKIIFNTIVKAKLNSPSIDELQLDEYSDCLTYKIELEMEKNNISGLFSRVSSEECYTNLLDLEKNEMYDKNEKKEKNEKNENLNLSTNCGREVTENNNEHNENNEYLAKNTETYMKTVASTEESEKNKFILTLGKFSKLGYLGSEKKKADRDKEQKFINIKNVKQNEEKYTMDSKINSKLFNFYNKDKKKISFIAMQQIQANNLNNLTGNLKKVTSNVVATVSRTEEENNNTKNPEILISPNKKTNNKIVYPLNFAGITGTKSQATTPRILNSNKNINLYRNSSKDNEEKDEKEKEKEKEKSKDKDIQFRCQISQKKNTIKSNQNLMFVGSNKSVDVKKLINSNNANTSTKKIMNGFVQNYHVNPNNNMRMSAHLDKNVNKLDFECSETDPYKEKKKEIKLNSFCAGKRIFIIL